jgi:hypothetical protein
MTNDNKGSVLPAGIGPHAGRELELMLGGSKPFAMFSDTTGSGWPCEALFKPHLAAGQFVARVHSYRSVRDNVTTRYLYIARAGEEWRIDKMHHIHFEIYCCGRPATDLDHIAIGLLLGYTKEETAAFIRHVRSGDAARVARRKVA